MDQGALGRCKKRNYVGEMFGVGSFKQGELSEGGLWNRNLTKKQGRREGRGEGYGSTSFYRPGSGVPDVFGGFWKPRKGVGKQKTRKGDRGRKANREVGVSKSGKCDQRPRKLGAEKKTKKTEGRRKKR